MFVLLFVISLRINIDLRGTLIGAETAGLVGRRGRRLSAPRPIGAAQLDYSQDSRPDCSTAAPDCPAAEAAGTTARAQTWV